MYRMNVFRLMLPGHPCRSSLTILLSQKSFKIRIQYRTRFPQACCLLGLFLFRPVGDRVISIISGSWVFRASTCLSAFFFLLRILLLLRSRGSRRLSRRSLCLCRLLMGGQYPVHLQQQVELQLYLL